MRYRFTAKTNAQVLEIKNANKRSKGDFMVGKILYMQLSPEGEVNSGGYIHRVFRGNGFEASFLHEANHAFAGL